MVIKQEPAERKTINANSGIEREVGVKVRQINNEVTYYRRDLSFNNWHKSVLPANYYATDIDLVDYDFLHGKPRPRILWDSKRGCELETPRELSKDPNIMLYKELAQQLGIPFYVVWSYKDDYSNQNDSINKFKVWDTSKNPNTSMQELKPEEMKKFVESMRSLKRI